MMLYTVVLSRKADKDETSIHNYIKEEFGETYAIDFSIKLVEFLQLLSKYPFIGRPSKDNQKFRVFIFRKKNKIVYRITKNQIVITRILSQKLNISGKY